MLPDEVVTTCPAFAPLRTGEVVISVPLGKLLEPNTLPVIEPSAFCLNPDMDGIAGAAAGFLVCPRDNVGELRIGVAAFLGGSTLAPGIRWVPKEKNGAGFFAGTGAGGAGLGGSTLAPGIR